MVCVTKTGFMSVFRGLCVAVTFGMIGYWCYLYVLDNDLSLVDSNVFSNIAQTYPIISLCFKDPFSEEKLKEIHLSLNGSLYLEFLNMEME